MNYLAHFHLAAANPSANTEGLIIGALLGDFVKGPLRGEQPADWELGIRLHRRVDALTDSSPHVQRLLSELPAGYRRFGGIMLDVCFDHCLSQHWPLFHGEPLTAFSELIYQCLARHESALPEAARLQAQRISQYDVLGAVQHWHTIESMLTRIGSRLSRDNPLAGCAPLLLDQLADIESAFLELYPELLEQLGREFVEDTTAR